MEEILQIFRAVLAPTGTIEMSDGLINYLHEETIIREVDSKEIILKIGQVNEHMIFVQQGLIRGYMENDDIGICAWFMNEGNLAIAVESYYGQKPTVEAIQALEDSVLLMMHRDKLEYAYRNFLEMNYIRAVLTEKYYYMGYMRERYLRMLDAANRLFALLTMQPWLFRRVKARYIASYLGITEQALSRIRKEFSKEIYTITKNLDID